VNAALFSEILILKRGVSTVIVLAILGATNNPGNPGTA
jgi:hypothetical protein